MFLYPGRFLAWLLAPNARKPTAPGKCDNPCQGLQGRPTAIARWNNESRAASFFNITHLMPPNTRKFLHRNAGPRENTYCLNEGRCRDNNGCVALFIRLDLKEERNVQRNDGLPTALRLFQEPIPRLFHQRMEYFFQDFQQILSTSPFQRHYILT